MISAFIPLPVPPEQFGYRPVPAVVIRESIAEGSPLPEFGGAGTGGWPSASFFLERSGYCAFEVVLAGERAAALEAPHVELMQQVKEGFGRTMSRLSAVFGVSRQTLYNWLAGETPKEVHHSKLKQLAAAARVFKEVGFKPTPEMLDRTVSQGKSLLQLISAGADGAESARKLVRATQRGADARAKLDAALGGRTRQRLDVSDMGAPSFSEDA